MAELIGTTQTSSVTGGDKFRVTWEYWLSSVLPEWFYDDAPALAERVRQWLPSVGIVPVSTPSAKPGDKVVVFDVRLAVSSWSNGRNVAQVLDTLDNVPAALRVQKLQRLTGKETSTELQTGQQDAITGGQSDAEQNAVGEWIGEQFKKLQALFGNAAKLVAVVAVAAIVVGGVYLYRESKK